MKKFIEFLKYLFTKELNADEEKEVLNKIVKRIKENEDGLF